MIHFIRSSGATSCFLYVWNSELAETAKLRPEGPNLVVCDGQNLKEGCLNLSVVIIHRIYVLSM